MWVKRIVYILILLASIAAFVVTDNAIALVFLVCMCVFPLISLVATLIARRSLRFELAVRESCIRGGNLQLTMHASVKPRFFVGGVIITVSIENTTFHKTEHKKFLFNDLSFHAHVYDYAGVDSGRICVKCESLKLVDLFGIFSVKAKCSAFAEAIVSPMLYDDVNVGIGNMGTGSVYGDTSLPRKGGDLTEIFNVRDYELGDSLHAVHWKLSGKFGSLKTKEFGATDDRKILILVDISRRKFGNEATDAQLNSVLDIAVSISNSLKSAGCPHTVGRFDNGVFECSEVTDGESFVQMVGKLMSIKVNEGDEDDMFYLSQSEECAVFTKIIFVSAFVNGEELRSVTSAEITAVEIGDEYGETNEQGVHIINIPCNNIRETLAACVI